MENRRLHNLFYTFVNFYGQDNAEHALGIAEVDAVYARRPGAKEFTIQSATAGTKKIPTADFEALANLDDDPPNALLVHYDLPNLKLIATGREDSTKAWLRRFLAHTKTTPAVEELRRLIR